MARPGGVKLYFAPTLAVRELSLVDAFSGYSAIAAAFYNWHARGSIEHRQASEWLPQAGPMADKAARVRWVLHAGHPRLALVHDATSLQAIHGPWAHVFSASSPCDSFSTANATATDDDRQRALHTLLLALLYVEYHIGRGYPPWLILIENAPTLANRFSAYGDAIRRRVVDWGSYHIHYGIVSPPIHAASHIDRSRWYLIGILPPNLRRAPPSSS